MPREQIMRPSLPETAAVLAAVTAYLQTLTGVEGGGDPADLRVHFEQLKASIAKVEAVTMDENDV